MLCNNYQLASLQAPLMADFYQSPVWVARLKDGRFLVTIRVSALVGAEVLSHFEPRQRSVVAHSEIR